MTRANQVFFRENHDRENIVRAVYVRPVIVYRVIRIALPLLFPHFLTAGRVTNYRLTSVEARRRA